MYRITFELLEHAHISSYVGRTCIILFNSTTRIIQEKKTNILHHTVSHNIYIDCHFWLCQYAYDPSNHIQSKNRKEHNSN